MPNLKEPLMEDLDILLDLVASISDYDEPQVREILEGLDLLDYRKRPISEATGLKMYLFQHLRQAHKLPEASGCSPWQQSPEEWHDLGVNGGSTTKEDFLVIMNSIRTGESLKGRKLLVWDPDLFDDAHRDFYRLQVSTRESRWVRVESEQGSMSLNRVFYDQTTSTCAKTSSGHCAPTPHFASTTSIHAELEEIPTISDNDSRKIHESDSEGSSEVSSIAGSDTELPYGAGYAWRSARQARLKTKPSRYRLGL
ncbi:uncharacterized protein FPRO_14892 [Fusarium proliferatum ET1]|uniref:Uncharacterized protein n=1 Tax=Fusarium proliferatum (strain ET1) TaxID=1227346 RepID=A0A1L7WAJ3_FUSPR|nr:uncharacterized protein FPRO_14892 [Fusarium proliferatum ET1]CZR49629.1 uncharacterized protein FPRO_14892 [Fusarium proliferatum ET1]